MLKNKLRFKLVDHNNNISFLIVDRGKVYYRSAGETLLSLINIAGNKAAELRFALEDACSEAAAMSAVRSMADYAKQIIKL